MVLSSCNNLLLLLLRLTRVGLNTMLWSVLLFAPHLVTRLLVRYLFYVLAMVLCAKMVLAIYKKERSNYSSYYWQCHILTFNHRFCNVDYVVLSSVKGVKLPRIVLTFDINCQYSKKFWERMKKFPLEMQIDEDTAVEFAIPSWHINAHGADCRADFGLSFRDGVGRTCGEEVEITWAGTNPLGPSTREMGPGARHETLNGQWGGLNFRRILNFRKFFFGVCDYLSNN
jgi:Kyakuja-Dileera-Zisupton transposase